MSDGTLSLFADDMHFYHPIRTPVDYQHLQIYIDSLCDRTDLNYLQLNSSKCKLILWLWLFLEKATNAITPASNCQWHPTRKRSMYCWKKVVAGRKFYILHQVV